MRSAMARTSPTRALDADGVAGAGRAGRTNWVAAMRSRSDVGPSNDSPTSTATLPDNASSAPLVTGLMRASRDHSYRKLRLPSAPRLAAPERPPGLKFGSSRVYVHSTNPVARPQNTALRVARRQYSPASIGGANWATAAKASRPIEARLAGATVLR